MLVPYQQHVGSSNVLVRAALAGRPVLGDSYGLIGHYVRENKLGITVDATEPGALTDGLKRCLLEPHEHLFDAELAQAFGQSNTATQCGQTIFDALQ